jgi:hypothetical protein
MYLSPELKTLAALDRETAKRSIRFHKLEVIDYTPSSPLPETQLAPTGSITVFLARKGEPLLQEVRTAARTGQGADRRLARKIQRQIALRPKLSVEEAARICAAQPVIAELRYAGATYWKNLFLPDGVPVGTSALPYNGGELAAEGFTLVEYFEEEDADQGFEVVLLRNRPVLSDPEKSALQKVPADMTQVNVGFGIGDNANTLLWLAAAVAVEVAIVWATFTITKGLDDKSMEHINPGAVASLGPIGTARALVNLRRDLLKGQVG